MRCERNININKQNIKIMIHSFKFRYGGRSMAGFFDDARNTLQIGKSHRGNVIDDIVTLDCSCVPKDSTLRVISSLDSPYKCVRLSTRKMMFKIWRVIFFYHTF